MESNPLQSVTALSMLIDEQRPAAKSDFMADARRAYEEKHPGKKFDDLAESTRKKYYYDAIHEYEARTGQPAFEMVGGRASFKDYFENIMTEQQRKDWLGPERYKLWKSGKYKFDDFVTPWPNRGVTVDMLKKADKAGLGVSPNGQQYQVSKDALAFAQTKIAQNVDATGLSSKSLDAITHRLADKMKKYGIEKFEDFLPTDNERAILGVSSDNKTFAFYAQTWNDIVENPRKTYRQSKGRPGELMQYAFDDPKNVISHCIDHELGHMIFNKSSVQNKDKMLLDLYLNNNFGRNLSQYAKKSPREFFAENFAIYERGGTLEPDIYNFIMEIIK